MIRLLATEAAHASWWHETLTMLRSPAHYVAEFTIETVGVVLGMHKVHALVHRVTRSVLRRHH